MLKKIRLLKIVALSLFISSLFIRSLTPSVGEPVGDILVSSWIILSSLLVLAFEAKNILLRLRKDILLSWCVFFSGIILSISFSKDIENSLSQFYKYATYFFVFLAASSLSLERKKIFTISLIASSALVSIIALRWFLIGPFRALDYLAHNNIRWDFATEFLSRGRAFMPFTLPGDLAGYLILFIPSTVLFIYSGTVGNKYGKKQFSVKNVVSLSMMLATILVLFSTQSIAAIFSLISAIAIFISIPLMRDKKNIFRISAICSLLALGLLLILFLRFNDPNEFNRPLFSITNRLEYWRHAVSVIVEHPLLGVGPGNYPYFKSIWAHNAYLQVWAEMGLLGMIGLVGIILSTVRIEIRNISLPKEWFFSGLWVGSLAFLLHNLLDTTLLHPQVSTHWWVLAGILSGKELYPGNKDNHSEYQD